MARPLRIQYGGAIYHVMARGNGRQVLFHEDRDYQRMTDGLQQTVGRTGWEVLSSRQLSKGQPHHAADGGPNRLGGPGLGLDA